jgi:hypothetical protein
MFCPQCGQQQVSGEMRFCSRCGFPLGGVIQLLGSGGVLATNKAAGDVPKQLSPRRRGYRQGALMMLLSLIATPLMAILTEAGLPELLIPLTAILFFWGGIIRIIYARVFEEAGVSPLPHVIPPVYLPPTGPQAQFGAGASQTALPAQRGMPASGWRQPTNTAELVPPPSVTENTTRLLDDRGEPTKH